MRLAVLDIGSNSAGLQIVDAEPGGPPLPAYATKAPIRLAETVAADGTVTHEGTERLLSAMTDALELAQSKGVNELIVFATAALRDAPNTAEISDQLRQRTGVG